MLLSIFIKVIIYNRPFILAWFFDIKKMILLNDNLN